MNRPIIARSRPPAYARFWPLAWLAVPAGLVAAPFYWLWHPLGDAVMLAAYVALWLSLWRSERRRPRAGAWASAEARVTVRRG